MRILFSIISIFFFLTGVSAQNSIRREGKVSYISSARIYAKFNSTDGIQKGDTVWTMSGTNKKALFIVDAFSSISCMGATINSTEEALVGQDIFLFIDKKTKETSETIVSKPDNENTIEKEDTEPQKKPGPVDEDKDILEGKVSLYSYSSFSDVTNNSTQRFRYKISASAGDAKEDLLSGETYIAFTHKAGQWQDVNDNIFNALKIYSLAAKIRPSDSWDIWLGRKINHNLSGIGAIDGLQIQNTTGDFIFGAVSGFRPDYSDYSFNTDLFEYGAYVGYNRDLDQGNIRNTVAFMEQRNNGNTDRRFLYFQHSNNLLKNVYAYASCELDLYSIKNDQPTNEASLTSLYLSLRFRPIKKLSIYTSYDARKNIIYYETFKNYLDRLLEDAMRQGFQTRVNYRPWNNMYTGLSYSYRKKNGDDKPTQNVRGYYGFTKFPWINASVNFSASYLQTAYLNGKIGGVRISKSFFKNKIYSNLNLRYVEYDYPLTDQNMTQYIGQIDANWRINKKLSFSLSYEGDFEKKGVYHLVFINIAQRF